MIYVNHRINTSEQLEHVPLQNGVELDVRYHLNELILHHDPFNHHEDNPEFFETFLKNWNHQGPMILNVKTEGIERKLIELMKKYNIQNWFFLDLSMPYFVIYAEHAANGDIDGFGPENLAVRYSERENINYALDFEQKVKWVWVDCFTYLPLDKKSYNALKNSGYNICIVSPELQKHSLDQIKLFQKKLKDNGIEVDAVCTKRPDLWGQNLSNEYICYLEKMYPTKD